jgi:hypothetical protein
MAHNKPNKPTSQTEPQSPEADLELILKLLPMLNTKQLGYVLEGVTKAL